MLEKEGDQVHDAKQLTRPPKEAPTIKIFGFVAPPEKFAVKSPRRSSPCLVSARTGVESHMAEANRDLLACATYSKIRIAAKSLLLVGLGGPGGCGRTGRNVQGELPV